MSETHDPAEMPLFSSAPSDRLSPRRETPERTEDQRLDVLQELGITADGDEKPARRRRRASTRVENSTDEPAADSEESDAQETPDLALPAATLLFQPPPAVPVAELTPEDEDNDEDDGEEPERESESTGRRRRRGGRGGRGRRGQESKDSSQEGSANAKRSRGEQDSEDDAQGGSGKARGSKSAKSENSDRAKDSAREENDGDEDSDDADDSQSGTRRRRRRRRRDAGERARAEVTPLKGSTRLEAKRQRRREGRQAGRRRQVITESEFLARRESVDRHMVVREKDGLNQIAVLEDNILVEHYVARHTQTSMVGNVYLGKVQNVLPSMEAAFVDLGKGRNAVLYAGEVNWDAVGLEGQPRRIEQALSSGDHVMVQVTKDPIGHKGARLTSQVTLAGRYLVLVPSGAMTGISRKLPDGERARLKKLLKDIVPKGSGVIVRTAAEGASEEQLRGDVERLTKQWAQIEKKAKSAKSAPVLLKGEPELAVRVVRDVFNDDFSSLTIAGDKAWRTLRNYVGELSPDLVDRMHHWTKDEDVFAHYRIDEQLSKGMDRKVFLPSGGSLVIDRTEAMTVIDVNTGRFTGKGGTLEETVTKNNIEAAEEIVRQLRLRDIGGIIVIDFIDMVLESNRDLVLRRLIECLGRDRTRHQVAEVTSLGLIQMTRKRVSQGLVEAFSETCEHCEGRGFIVHDAPVEKGGGEDSRSGRRRGQGSGSKKRSGRGGQSKSNERAEQHETTDEEAAKQARSAVRETLQTIAAAAAGSKGSGKSSAPASDSADGGPEAENSKASHGSRAKGSQNGSAKRSERATTKEKPSRSRSTKGKDPARAEDANADAEESSGTSGSKPRRSRRASTNAATTSKNARSDSPKSEREPRGTTPADTQNAKESEHDTSETKPRTRRRVVATSGAPAAVSDPVNISQTAETETGSATVVASGTGAKKPRRSRRATSSPGS
ncbi:MAG: Rne/Rng family ribonuclease [Bowdeniella nasicola]|nr:Rne/Rng family ribonuclease [Bowdeniella nasicola]